MLAINAVSVPIYPTLTGDQIAVLLADAGCRIAIVSTRQQFDKLNAVRSRTQLERILLMDANAPDGAIGFSKSSPAQMMPVPIVTRSLTPSSAPLSPTTSLPSSTHLEPPASPRA